ncbi:hypothetical protein V8D89_006962 [Ganoderma adspersum]
MSNSTSLESNSGQPPRILAGIDETFGAILIGTSIALVVYGFSLVQAVRYFRLYRVDTRFIRGIVCLTLALDLVHTVLSINACIIASVCFLFTIIRPGNLIYIGISNIAAKVYVFSMLTAIKSRKSFSTRLMEDAHLGRPALITSPAWTRRSPVQLSVDEASVIEFAPVAVLSVNTCTSSSLSTMGHSKRDSPAAMESDSTAHGPSTTKIPSKEEVTAALSPLQPSPLSEEEIYCFFAGLPSRPLLIARTGAPWKPIPLGPWHCPYERELRPVGEHAIAAPGVWENQVGPALLQVLDEEAVRWNTIDVHRIHYIDFDNEAPFPVVVCIGVKFGLLSGEDGARVAKQCQEVLDGFGLGDVEIAIKASERFQAARVAPAFEEPTNWYGLEKDPMAKFHLPFTPGVGFPVSGVAYPDVEGSGGFFFTNGEDTSKVYLLTARHVVIKTTTRDKNTVYDHKAGARPRRKDVTLFSEKGIVEYLKSVRVALGSRSRAAELYREWIDDAKAEDDKAQGKDESVTKRLEMHQRELEEAQATVKALDARYVDVAKLYLSELGRTLGFVSYSPPIGFSLGEHKYTEDVAIIEVDADKINTGTFRSNVMDRGSDFGLLELMKMINPRRRNPENPSSFESPIERVRPLRGIIPDAELRDPKQKDFNGDPCTMVVKRGKTSGLTFGRLNNMPSYTRTYWEDGTSDVSMEWPIFSYRHYEVKRYPVAFSKAGDSGSVVVDGKGRIAGIITSGSGYNPVVDDDPSPPAADVTYMTAADFLYNQMLTRGIDMNVNFTLDWVFSHVPPPPSFRSLFVSRLPS